MRYLLISLLLLNLCFAQNQDFLKKVTSELVGIHNSSSFISIKVKSLNYSGEIVIENSNLYSIFNSLFNMSNEQYKDAIQKILSEI